MATLWDVITDEDIFKKQTVDIKNNILHIFSDNIKGFYNAEIKNSNITLMEMNKKYILLILNFIKTTYSGSGINKIVIHPEPEERSITSEERQQDRMTQMNRELSLLEEDFKNSITLHIPSAPNFTDDIQETPIAEMERAVKEMAEQRKYDMDQINKNISISLHDTEWLQPQKTSLKPQIMNTNNNNNNNKLKHIHWADETNNNVGNIDNIQITIEEKEEQSIFAKLKKVEKVEPVEFVETEKSRITTLEENVKSLDLKIEKMNESLMKIMSMLNK